ncbi:MAG TPA: M24 family metallopeptidase [Acidobacteriota bacterium]|nr:M24 family metallopeptidase [Acidobacteriota bacterium]
MNPAPDIETIQASLREADVDGWLLYDFHGLNPIAAGIAGVTGIVTRRWFLLVPTQGVPRWIMHTIEQAPFAGKPGEFTTYSSWQELDRALAEALAGCKRVAMEYSPGNAIPYVARVDAGMIEKIRSFGPEIVSSADLVAQMLARWTPDQIRLHREAAAGLIAIKDAAFDLITARVRDGATLCERDVVTFVHDCFAERGMETDSGPIVAVGPNAGNPHYEPAPTGSAPIGPDNLVLIDMWAKLRHREAVYADISWVGYTGTEVPKTIAAIFDIVARARDRAVSFLNEKLSAGATVMGCEVDRAVRGLITDCGYGACFVHRTGHSIGTDVHGVGPNIDDLETQDRRLLRNGMAFSIEPGIYLPEFGVRSEIDCLIENDAVVVTTLPLQTEITRLV